MEFKKSIELFCNYINSYCSFDTMSYYEINLKMFSDFMLKNKKDKFFVSELKKNDYIEYISFLRTKGIKNTSIRTYARAVKVYLKYLYNEGYIFTDITLNVRFPRADSRAIVPLSNSDVKKIIDSLSEKCRDRDILIFLLMLECGLRLQEVVNLDINDIDFDNNIIKINNSKYNKSRFVPLTLKVKTAIENYNVIRADNVNALVLNNHNNTRVSKCAIKKLFNRIKLKYSIVVYPHLLRHTFATSFIMGGGNIEILRILMGHTDYNVTKNYIHLASQFSLLNYDIYKLDKCVFRSYMAYNMTT